jgi:hypothetical protein
MRDLSEELTRERMALLHYIAQANTLRDELVAVLEKAEEFFSDPQAFTPTAGKKFCALIRAAIAKAKETT